MTRFSGSFCSFTTQSLPEVPPILTGLPPGSSGVMVITSRSHFSAEEARSSILRWIIPGENRRSIVRSYLVIT
ncbi:uncharacterized protein YALI1_C03225g [Yarrowia lipolytica]|uniref:Uncharacterized protein n=1 Tax=Yarrowia lipolytica TaxID=4952 RepID=A0A1D8N9B3_YARLL|nr:hypothetical protein YALI1_C03225g [Yarrowia lipolytica]